SAELEHVNAWNIERGGGIATEDGAGRIGRTLISKGLAVGWRTRPDNSCTAGGQRHGRPVPTQFVRIVSIGAGRVLGPRIAVVAGSSAQLEVCWSVKYLAGRHGNGRPTVEIRQDEAVQFGDIRRAQGAVVKPDFIDLSLPLATEDAAVDLSADGDGVVATR